jgi:hypothetical protein
MLTLVGWCCVFSRGVVEEYSRLSSGGCRFLQIEEGGGDNKYSAENWDKIYARGNNIEL